MKKTKNEELQNVNGGTVPPIENLDVYCPACSKKVTESKSLVKKEKSCGITYEYYKCEHCGHEWKI